MRLAMPRLYVILDAEMLREPVWDAASGLMDAGVQLLQYRAKTESARQIFEGARALSRMARERGATLLVNDRPDVAYLAGASGVHVGQDDLGVEESRAVMGPKKLIGISTHNREQFQEALKTTADYIAVGPIFATSTKQNPDAVVGSEFLRSVRKLTSKPIVAIGGITLERAEEVMEAGADSVAVIRDILQAADPARRAKQFIERLDAAKAAATH